MIYLSIISLSVNGPNRHERGEEKDKEEKMKIRGVRDKMGKVRRS